MSDDRNNPTPGNDPLQFDVAEATTSHASRPGTMCKACTQPITDAYYQVNDSIVCASCRALLEPRPGTRLRRVLRAMGLGALAAIAGSLLYFAVAAITGREFGIVAIAVGFMVGSAVRKGSGGRGGWAYQTLAIGLTYMAIVSTYVPLLVKEFQKDAKERAATHAPAPTPMDTITISARGPVSGSPRSDSIRSSSISANAPIIAQAGAPAGSHPPRTDAKHLGAGTLLLGIGALVFLAALVPIAAGFSNIIGLLIIGFAVFQAWKLNQRLKVTGPFRIAAGPQTGTIG
jgi:hypothetical protein